MSDLHTKEGLSQFLLAFIKRTPFNSSFGNNTFNKSIQKCVREESFYIQKRDYLNFCLHLLSVHLLIHLTYSSKTLNNCIQKCVSFQYKRGVNYFFFMPFLSVHLLNHLYYFELIYSKVFKRKEGLIQF